VTHDLSLGASGSFSVPAGVEIAGPLEPLRTYFYVFRLEDSLSAAASVVFSIDTSNVGKLGSNPGSSRAGTCFRGGAYLPHRTAPRHSSWAGNLSGRAYHARSSCSATRNRGSLPRPLHVAGLGRIEA
jgi:hypothetical protein